MKARHVVAFLIGAGVVAWALVSCNMSGAVSIDQRISDFQADLNTSDRSNVYQDFHPTQTAEYNALKNPLPTGQGGSGFDTLFPVPTPTYSLSVINESNPSAGVVVQVTSGPPDGDTWTPPNLYLLLAMATYNSNDWRIVTLGDSNVQGTYTTRIQ